MTNMIEGIDVSMIGQGKSIKWQKEAQSGIQWAALKIGQGNGFVDPAYQTNLAGCRAAGILPMPYFFLSHDAPAAQQAEQLLRLLDRPHNPDLLLPALDVEPDPLSKRALFHKGACYGTSYSSGYMVRLVDDVMTYVRQGCNGVPGIGKNLTYYSYQDFHRHYMGDTHNYAGACPLWIASYPSDGTPPPEPTSWGGWAYWTFWQYTDNGNVGGLHVDRDRFKGTIEDLRKFANY